MLKVENLTQGTTVVERGRIADNAWTRFKGLIGVRELAEGDGLAIIPCSGVHCMFMSIPIDVVYVDKEDRRRSVGREYEAVGCGSHAPGCALRNRAADRDDRPHPHPDGRPASSGLLTRGNYQLAPTRPRNLFRGNWSGRWTRSIPFVRREPCQALEGIDRHA